ncbi:hypothetical protein CC86DRAFT_44154 [Ophiobolus disseminans]|uniref:Uncharacterized protein n=1 Tax=Ophiobolus disseminans TaxID=1469910 RepID=A0A6A6ZYL5_9PLEO|nr:hypothetical protein CC86DRAFT_44154 [Ophiobolus disseminans]
MACQAVWAAYGGYFFFAIFVSFLALRSSFLLPHLPYLPTSTSLSYFARGTAHPHPNMPTFFKNEEEKRGLIIVCVVLLLSTIGVFCFIVGIIVCKNKCVRRRGQKKLMQEKIKANNEGLVGRVLSRTNGNGKGKGRYARLGDEERGLGGGIVGGIDERERVMGKALVKDRFR